MLFNIDFKTIPRGFHKRIKIQCDRQRPLQYLQSLSWGVGGTIALTAPHPGGQPGGLLAGVPLLELWHATPDSRPSELLGRRTLGRPADGPAPPPLSPEDVFWGASPARLALADKSELDGQAGSASSCSSAVILGSLQNNLSCPGGGTTPFPPPQANWPDRPAPL